MKNINKGLWYLFTYCLALPLLAMPNEDGQLLRKDYLLYQAWSVSRNYYFGTTVKPDKIYALAWQLVYTTLLPKTYPQKEELLFFYKKGLSKAQQTQAAQLAEQLITKYYLHPSLSEAELARAYLLRDANNNWKNFEAFSASKKVIYRFKNWITWIATHYEQSLAEKLDYYAYTLSLAHQFPIIYGQINVKGPELPQMVQSEVKIFPYGFFVGHPNSQTINFALAGYKTATIKLENKSIQAIPTINLEPLPHTKNTGLIGRVVPWSGLTTGNIMLVASPTLAVNLDEPWLQPTIPLTITESGEFYATGLAPGRYQLFINTANLSTKINITLKKEEVRGLSLIKLGKKI
ncbi:hypothetical protein ACNVED_09745 [Legionella sp. D16C41]|uniref:hypothetical protein n=1 Tax=Legionella sp. D16C41 TaxID=3402688 RepID=UPI003AF9C2D5